MRNRDEQSSVLLHACLVHREIREAKPGTCPKCGMALEPRTALAEEENPKLIDMTRRFRVSLVLTVPFRTRQAPHLLHSLTWVIPAGLQDGSSSSSPG